GRQGAADRFDAQALRIGHAERLGDDVAVRMRARLFVRDRTLLDQLLHVGMVLRQLLEFTIPHVYTAVADPADFVVGTAQAQRGDGRTHRPRLGLLAGVLDDFFVGALHRLRERRALRDFLDQRIARQRAGDLAVLVAAHAVGYQPEAELRVGIIRVFV